MNVLRDIRDLLHSNHAHELVARLDVLILGFDKGVELPNVGNTGPFGDMVWDSFAADGDLTPEQEVEAVHAYLEALGLGDL